MIDVTFDRVSKRYRMSGGAPQPDAIGAGPAGSRTSADFWAVRDVTFEVARGETLGIIGHNGAGKSTLLKLLSRITTPTHGEITLNGRLAALIEVGSGFHPELTGRENVFLSGSVLGMRRREIQEKFDRIVEFSGVTRFIDTPVKWYSSGMYVRLGFAIAAHLDPDILLVDEVLAVGDAAFQVQCYERLAELRRNGTTMLFISHDLASVEKLCDRVALMQHGRLVASGSPHEIVTAYQGMVITADTAALADAHEAEVSPQARVHAIGFADIDGGEALNARTGAPLTARVEVDAAARIDDAVVELFFYSRDGRTLHCQYSTAFGNPLTLRPGRSTVEFTTPELGLQPGVYVAGATIRERSQATVLDWFYGRTLLYVEPGKSVRGYFYSPHAWRMVDGHGPSHDRHPHV